jgi:hypothetical protein
MPSAPPRNGAGEFALVMGIVAALFSIVPIVGEFVAAPASVLAVVLGCIGIKRADDGLATNPGQAWLGVGLGVAGGFVTLLVFAVTLDMAASLHHSRDATPATLRRATTAPIESNRRNTPNSRLTTEGSRFGVHRHFSLVSDPPSGITYVRTMLWQGQASVDGLAPSRANGRDRHAPVPWGPRHRGLLGDHGAAGPTAPRTP